MLTRSEVAALTTLFESRTLAHLNRAIQAFDDMDCYDKVPKRVAKYVPARLMKKLVTLTAQRNAAVKMLDTAQAQLSQLAQDAYGVVDHKIEKDELAADRADELKRMVSDARRYKKGGVVGLRGYVAGTVKEANLWLDTSTKKFTVAEVLKAL